MKPPPEPSSAKSAHASGPPLDLLLEVDDDAVPSGGDGWVPDAAFLHDWALHALAGSPESTSPGSAGLAGGAGGETLRHELSVRLVGADAMRGLNRDWRGRDAPTNVLSFPAGLPALPDASGGTLLVLGDIALCPTVIGAEATAQGKGLDAHWAHLIVHGVLHLRGLDHEDDASAAAMEGLERRLLSVRDLPDPYAGAGHP